MPWRAGRYALLRGGSALGAAGGVPDRRVPEPGAGEPAKAPTAPATADSAVAGPVRGGYDALERWARAQTPVGSGLEWWETAASAGSSLCVYALIAAGAQRRLDAREITHIEQAYFPWIGALHSLLDNLVDVAEDHATGQHNLIGCYASHPGSEHAATPACGTLAAGRAGTARRWPRFDSGGDGELLSRHARSLCPRGAPRGPCRAGSARRTGRAGAARLPPPHAP